MRGERVSIIAVINATDVLGDVLVSGTINGEIFERAVAEIMVRVSDGCIAAMSSSCNVCAEVSL